MITATLNSNKQKFKNTAIGAIPVEWDALPAIKIADVRDGTHDSPKYVESGVKFITSKNIKAGKVDFTEVFFISSIDAEKINKRSKVDKNDILISMIGTIGNAVLIDFEPDFCIKNIGLFKPNKKLIKPEYLIQYFYSPLFQNYLKSELDGGIQKFISLGGLRDLIIPIPLLIEQNKISTLLDTWDKAIETATGLISAKEKLKKAIIQKLYAGKKRFKEYTNKSWEIVTAGHIFKNHSQKNNSGEALLSITQDCGAIPRDMLEGRVTMPSGETNSYKLVDIGDFIISLRSFQGGIEYSNYRGIVSPAYTILKPLKPIDNDFYKHHFKTTDFISRLGSAIIGIRDGKQINFEDFERIKIPYPSVAEQQKIASVINLADEEINLLKQELTALQQQKKGLMQVLLTGKVRVKIK